MDNFKAQNLTLQGEERLVFPDVLKTFIQGKLLY